MRRAGPDGRFLVPRWGRIIVAVCSVIFIIAFMSASFTTVPAGHRGVPLKFGEVQERTLFEGLHPISAFIENVIVMDVRTQKLEATGNAASKDLQTTTTTVAVNYHLDPTRVNEIYRTLGLNYAETFISPAIQETVKASTAKFTAEELIKERVRLKDAVDEGLKARLEQRGIIVETVSIVNFKFSDDFEKAIEDQAVANRKINTAKNDLERIRVEAEQAIAKAKGEAEAIKIVQQELRQSPEYVRYLYAQKWDGQMPMVLGGDGQALISLPPQNKG
jgi:regulator of protease activity HflC (stomatin/prohibitin superfamily)